MRHIKNIVLLAILLTTVVGFFVIPDISRVHCGFADNDPEPIAYFLADGTQVTKQQFNDAIVQRLLTENPGTTLGAPGQGGGQGGSASAATAPAQPAMTTSPNNTVVPAPAAPKEKVAVSFTDENGNFIGSTQVTKGTDVATSQFPLEVPECNGKTFDSWDYDGSLMMHDWIIRAKYK